MLIVIDTTYRLRAPRSGTGVYLDRICAALRATGEVDVVEVANQSRRPPAGGGLGSMRNLTADLRWTQVTLPALARRHRADVLHHPLPAVAMAPGDLAQVITVHDLAFVRLPKLFDPSFRRYAALAHRAAARRAEAVIAVSETTALDLRSAWMVDPGRIVVAPHGPGQALPAAPRPPEPAHFLYVGDAEPRKDLGTLRTAYARYRAEALRPLPLVVAGAGTAVDPGRLAELYAGAAALVHPARYEGFGLTALEAMAAGTPVVAADAPGVREVCGEAALWFPPGDAGGLAAALTRVASDPGLRASLADRGRARAAAFTWEGAARAHVAAYSLAMGIGPTHPPPPA